MMALSMCDCAACDAYEHVAREMDDRMRLYAGPRYLLCVAAG